MIDQIQNVGSLSKVTGLDSIATDAVSSTTTTVGATPGSMTGVSFASVLGDMATAMHNIKQAEVTSFEASPQGRHPRGRRCRANPERSCRRHCAARQIVRPIST
jgi:hypothetical protein